MNTGVAILLIAGIAVVGVGVVFLLKRSASEVAAGGVKVTHEIGGSDAGKAVGAAAVEIFKGIWGARKQETTGKGELLK